MRLVRFGSRGEERPGVIDSEGQIRDLAGLIKDIDADILSEPSLSALGKVDLSALPVVPSPKRLGVPWKGINKFIGVGLNYYEHAKESAMPIPKEPILFAKWTSCLSGPSDDIVIPPQSKKLDWEVELGIVIGRCCKNIASSQAHHYIAGYCLVMDVSEREFQLKRGGGQWCVGKGFDTFGPVGPYLVTADEIQNPQDLDLMLTVNGVQMQRGNTRDMIFTCVDLVSYCSHVMTLEPGDLIITGTPAGVGMGRIPQQFLNPGDVVELGNPTLGFQRHLVVNPYAC